MRCMPVRTTYRRVVVLQNSRCVGEIGYGRQSYGMQFDFDRRGHRRFTSRDDI
jgi:hypothetical protein